jgi:hypothetical protein
MENHHFINNKSTNSMVIFHIYVELPEGKAQQPWPQRFYVITYESGTGLQHFLLALIIGGVLLACMFPVWPMWAKARRWGLTGGGGAGGGRLALHKINGSILP